MSSAADKVLQFQAFSNSCSVSFWKELASRKLETYKLSDAAQTVTASYTSCADPRLPSTLMFDGASFGTALAPATTEDLEQRKICYRECRVECSLRNFNTVDAFKKEDKNAALAAVAAAIWKVSELVCAVIS
jgi:ubiquitin-like modifier-activating enzyme ATG7